MHDRVMTCRRVELNKDMTSTTSTLSTIFFFFPTENGIRNLVRARGLGDVYKSKDSVLTHKKKCKKSAYLPPG